MKKQEDVVINVVYHEDGTAEIIIPPREKTVIIKIPEECLNKVMMSLEEK